ncbi:MAG TPA: bifunctional [glutamate--ammonia ligase]-adenylyl-L-tyrosine phosphorylase/[glutamate--ammonia-ligase] adenylyltransferase [Geobacteraceae bacterium]|nr:bifunctional [glutamate--ammonia ligase]-adenylyl-L-tyrosine phosphorylase/[glutamate--ammonia-ligase] adenylyltransferase [Geobacteraceae bacterium]
MNRNAVFAEGLEAALAAGPEGSGNGRLTTFLESRGFVHGARSAANLRLLAQIFPLVSLRAITMAALSTPAPDMALNGLERISAMVPRDDLLVVCAKKGWLSQLLFICGSSPFLTNIICRDPTHFRGLFLDRRIELRRSEGEMLALLRAQVGDKTGYQDLLLHLRSFKVAEILRIAARDLNGLATLEEVTAEITALAAATLQVACEVTRRDLMAEYGAPLMQTPCGEKEAELTIIGMGKFGGRELNFSSDIDLIYLYSSDEGETSGIARSPGLLKGKISLHTFFVKQTEMITRALSLVTEDGFVFRVDLGLRPEGKSGEMAVSLHSAASYYEYWGQSWERAAMLKARPVAGSLELGEQFLAVIEPFIYRKYLDYDLIEDMMVMKKKIDASLAREREGEYNIKLGRGGIREIEFFIQALQLVYAGKNPLLRRKNSLEALTALKEARIIMAEVYSFMAEAYSFLRTVEHRIQVVQERQSHSLPRKDEEFRALARRCGYLRADGAERFRAVLEAHRRKVSAIYGGLFLFRDERLKEEVRPELYYFFDPGADPDLLKDMLDERGFRDVESAYTNLLLLRDGPPRARLTERSRRILEKISPLLLQEIFASPDPDMALSNLERFLCAIGSRSSFYALLAENRETLKLIVSLFGMSEFLSKIAIAHPELLESMVARSSTASFKERQQMDEELAAFLAPAVYFEDRLDILRRYRHEEFLRIGMNDIHGNMEQTDIATQLTRLAEASLNAACGMAQLELARFGRPTYLDENGEIRDANFAIIGMGKMGGGELNYHSDLDIIYIYDRQGETNGERRISNHEYFAKVGQKIISILTTQTREGYVYKIDTRLRPSGNAGPLVTSLDSFRSYHRDEAQIWERQALTKARVVYGDEALTKGIEEVIRDTVYGAGADESVRSEIHHLRMRMETEIARESAGSYNIKTGRGGMVDVEFIVQYLQLAYGRDFPDIRGTNTIEALQAIKGYGLIPEGEGDTLLNGYTCLRRMENRLRIVHDYSMNDLGGSREYLNKLARRLGYDPNLRNPGEVMMKDYEDMTGAIRRVYDKILGEGG